MHCEKHEHLIVANDAVADDKELKLPIVKSRRIQESKELWSGPTRMASNLTWRQPEALIVVVASAKFQSALTAVVEDTQSHNVGRSTHLKPGHKSFVTEVFIPCDIAKN